MTVSDTLGTSFTLTARFDENIFDNIMQCFYGIAPSSGSDTVHITGFTAVNQNTNVAEFTNPTGSLAFDVTATVGSGTAPSSQTLNLTTAVNGDLLAVDTAASQSSFQFYGSFPQIFAAGTSGGASGSGANLISFVNLGVAGAQTYTQVPNTVTMGGSTHWGMIGLAFKPSTIAITTDVMPHGAQTTPYKATLEAVGGNGAYTYAASGLPGWATLHTATGVIDGTPNANGCTNFTATVTDGSVTSAPQALTLCAGSTFASPAVVQSKVSTSGGTLTFNSSVTSGNVLMILGYGPEAAGADNWVLTDHGNHNSLTGSFGTTFKRVNPITTVVGTGNGAPTAVYIGCAAGTGSMTVTANSDLSPAYVMAGAEISGAQSVVDDATNGNFAGMSDPFTNTTQTYTAQVANEILFTSLTIGKDSGLAQAPVINAPFTQLYSGPLGGALVQGAAGYRNVTTATTYTASATVTGTGSGLSGETIAQQLIGLRPAISGLGCSGVPVASSAVPHRVREY